MSFKITKNAIASMFQELTAESNKRFNELMAQYKVTESAEGAWGDGPKSITRGTNTTMTQQSIVELEAQSKEKEQLDAAFR